MKKNKIIKIILVLLIFGAFFVVPAACEPGIDFKIVNKTDSNIKVYTRDFLRGNVAPGKILIYRQWATYSVYPITVTNVKGDIIYAVNITRNDISGKKTYEIVIPSTLAK